MTAVRISWPLARSHPVLGNFEIHVWAATLQQNAENILAQARSLSPGEQARAAGHLGALPALGSRSTRIRIR